MVFGMTRPWLEPTIYRTSTRALYHYATDAVRIIRSCMDAAETHIHDHLTFRMFFSEKKNNINYVVKAK